MSLTEEQKHVLAETRKSPEYLKHVQDANAAPPPTDRTTASSGTTLTLSLGLKNVDLYVSVPGSPVHQCNGNGPGTSSSISVTGTFTLLDGATWAELVAGPSTYTALAQTTGKVNASFFAKGVLKGSFAGTTTGGADVTADCSGDCVWT